MMDFRLKNVPAVMAAFRKYPERFFPAVQRGMVKGMQEFNGQIVRAQMTGRPGLKRQTGTLARANRVIQRGWGRSFMVQGQFGAPNAPYVVVHQTGMHIYPKKAKYLRWQNNRGEWFAAKHVYIPKRLHIPEQYRVSGPDTLLGAVAREVAKEFQRTQMRY